MRPKGHWIAIGYMNRKDTDTFRCSACDKHIYLQFTTEECDYKFCPYCGSRMNQKEKKSEEH